MIAPSTLFVLAYCLLQERGVIVLCGTDNRIVKCEGKLCWTEPTGAGSGFPSLVRVAVAGCRCLFGAGTLECVLFCVVRALCFLSLKQYRDAVRDCDEALMIDSFNVKALYRRAQAHKELQVSRFIIISAPPSAFSPQKSDARLHVRFEGRRPNQTPSYCAKCLISRAHTEKTLLA